MQWTSSILFLFATINVVVLAQDSIAKAEVEQLDVYHKVPGSDKFTLRAHLHYNPIKATAKYTTEDVPASIQDSDHSAVKALNGNKDGLYRIAIAHHGTPENEWPMTYTKACLLTSSNLDEEIILHLDQYNRYFHFDYYTSSNTCDGNRSATASEFKPKIHTRRPVTSVKPRLNKPVQVKADGTVQEPPPKKSFLQQYWFVIAAILFFMVAGGGGGQPQGGGESSS